MAKGGPTNVLCASAPNGSAMKERLGSCRLCGRKNIYEFARQCPRCKVDLPVSLPPEELPPAHPITKALVLMYYGGCLFFSILWLVHCANN